MDKNKYNPKEIEPKWQKFWEENPNLYAANDASDKPKKYILDMFPYPSGEGLHAGHVESYTATDIISRYYRLNGKNVLHPQGWDAFGLPAENYAIKTRVHPAKTTAAAIKNFKRQMKMMGFSYDWSREINSSDLDYYRWTQWFFLLLYKNKLAYRAKAKVNWCENCKTVLANEQVIDGECERCGGKVIQKDLEQWFFRITDFIEDRPHPVRLVSDHSILGKERVKTSGLISGLNKVDWPESTKAAQRNWIGRSEGAIIKFKVQNAKFKIAVKSSKLEEEYLEVFTTRLDTIYGCTYMVIAPEHSFIEKHKEEIENLEEVKKYLEDTKKKSDLARMENKDKTGVEINGIKAINPFTLEEVPIFVADYVLVQYGTGAVMAVPAHDERDFEFARKYKLLVKKVILPPVIFEIPQTAQDAVAARGGTGGEYRLEADSECYTDDGELINSKNYTGLVSEKAREKMAEWLVKNNLGGKKVNYKMRDWLVSRQRYWGAPIPIIYCDKCGEVPVPEKDLPVELPTDVDFKPTGESPLKYSKNFQNVKCPKCGEKAKRESDTMDTFVCSSWYYFRYADPKNAKEFANKNLLKKWLPVDLYVGGAEHTVLHLLYSRFFTKALHNLGYIDFDEPFLKLRHQGIILAADGRKMSKSLGNVINPDDEVKKYGADALRLFEMFMGPLEDSKPWQTNGMVGMSRFLEKIWRLKSKVKSQTSKVQIKSKKSESLTHKTIKKVGEDIENLRFNTAISALMILTNEFDKQETLAVNNYELLIILLSPFAPFIAEKLWNQLGHKKSIFKEKWPEYDPKLIKDEEIELVIQINGKVRDRVKVGADIPEEVAKKIALESEKIKTFINNQKIKKVIFVRGRLVNIVI